MKDEVTTLDGAIDGVGMGQVAERRFDAGVFEIPMHRSRQRPHVVASGDQPIDDGLAEESAAAGDEDVHRSCVTAHSANFSRKILALWRTSTGKRGWKRKSLILLVCGNSPPSFLRSSTIARWSAFTCSLSSSTQSTGLVSPFDLTLTSAVRRTFG